jgi:ribonuclease HI
MSRGLDGKFTLRFDGASSGNPGPSGCGWVLLRGLPGDGPGASGEERVDEGWRSLGKRTNNDAEYEGLIAGLRGILDGPFRSQVQSLHIQGDSNLVINQLQGKWKINFPHLRTLRDQALEELRKIGCKWSAGWIRRELNGDADNLARKGSLGSRQAPS